MNSRDMFSIRADPQPRNATTMIASDAMRMMQMPMKYFCSSNILIHSLKPGSKHIQRHSANIDTPNNWKEKNIYFLFQHILNQTTASSLRISMILLHTKFQIKCSFNLYIIFTINISFSKKFYCSRYLLASGNITF